MSTSSADVRDDSSGPSQCLLGFVRVNARSLDEASTSAPKYEEPLECGQVRARDDAIEQAIFQALDEALARLGHRGAKREAS